MHLYGFEFAAMASNHELKLWSDDETRAHEVAARAIADVQRIERKYSRFREDSVIAAINAAAGSHRVPIDAETAALLEYADACYELSGGAFDVTSGVLRRAWNFRRDPPALPTAAAVQSLLELVGWRDVERSAHEVFLRRAGMELDFGGIAKEYAADRVASVCVDAGLTHGLINLGGDVRVMGAQPDGSPWRIGIGHPRAEGAIASVALCGGAVATSGDYERFFDIDNVRYCHIIDARTGWPVTQWQSISVVAPLCVVAGSYATIAMLMQEAAVAFLRDSGVAYVAVDRLGRVSDGMESPAADPATPST